MTMRIALNILIIFLIVSPKLVALEQDISIFPIKNFMGRKKLINDIHEKVQQGFKKIYIVGEGGIGKTELMKKYYQINQEVWDIALWLDIANDLHPQVLRFIEKIEGKFCKGLCKIPISESNLFEGIQKFAKKHNLNLAIFIDNVNSMQKMLWIENLLSRLDFQKFFISRRRVNVEGEIIVSGFNEEETKEYLNKTLNTDVSQEDIKNIYNAIDGNVLGLEQVVTFVKTHNISLKKFHKIFKKNKKEIIGSESSLIHSDENPKFLYNLIVENIKYVDETDKVAGFLLRKMAYLSSIFDENILASIYFSNNPEDDIVLLKAISLLRDNFFIKDKRINYQHKHSREFFMHDYIRETILEELKDEFVNKENIIFLLDALVHYLPESSGALGVFMEEKPSTLFNLEKVLNHAEKYNIKNKNVLILKIKLLRIYLHTYQYDKVDKASKEIEYIIENNSEVIDITTPKAKEILCSYNLLMGQYWNYKFLRSDRGLQYFENAEKLSNEIESKDLQFLSKIHLSQAYLGYGKYNKAREYFDNIDNEMKDYLQTTPFKPFYFFMHSRFKRDMGDYEEALAYINEALNAWESKDERRRVAQYLQKAEILIDMEETEESKALINKVEEICNGNTREHRMLIARNERIKGLWYMYRKDFDSALRHLNKAIELYTNGNDIVEGIKDKNSYLADAYVGIGDLNFKKGEYSKAKDFYISAFEIYQNRANGNSELFKVSSLCLKICKVALELNDKLLLNRYYTKHKNLFGLDNKVGKKIYKFVAEYDRKNF